VCSLVNRDVGIKVKLIKLIKYLSFLTAIFLVITISLNYFSQQARKNEPWPADAKQVIISNCIIDYKKSFPVQFKYNQAFLKNIFKDSCFCIADEIEAAQVVKVLPDYFQSKQEFQSEFIINILAYYSGADGKDSRTKCSKITQQKNHLTAVLFKPVLAELFTPRCMNQASQQLKDNSQQLNLYCDCMIKQLSNDFVEFYQKNVSDIFLNLTSIYLENMTAQFHTDNKFHTNCKKVN
jgi:hypothetical protein